MTNTQRPARDLRPVPTDYGIEGPYEAPPIVIPWWVVVLGVLAVLVIAGYVSATV